MGKQGPLHPLSPPSQSAYEISNYATEQVVFLKAVALRSIVKEQPWLHLHKGAD